MVIKFDDFDLAREFLARSGQNVSQNPISIINRRYASQTQKQFVLFKIISLEHTSSVEQKQLIYSMLEQMASLCRNQQHNPPNRRRPRHHEEEDVSLQISLDYNMILETTSDRLVYVLIIQINFFSLQASVSGIPRTWEHGRCSC